ncbi:MAG: hypothetical protein LBU81_05390 [Methanosarcinales archaeon]|jgi:ACT domain-containing protein|nr:hypothetical protein [Methanosarcinales archaeon]
MSDSLLQSYLKDQIDGLSLLEKTKKQEIKRRVKRLERSRSEYVRLMTQIESLQRMYEILTKEEVM